MKYNYDEYYTEEDLFGKPYKELLEFFKNHEPKGLVLDLGCGQGRDSVPIGRMGYTVIGIDESEVGLDQMNEKSRKEGLDVKGIKNDIYSYEITELHDIVLMDSMLHFYKNDMAKETALVKRIASELKKGGILCNFMQKGRKREKIYKDILNEVIEFELLKEAYADYLEYDSKYHMYAIRKVSDL